MPTDDESDNATTDNATTDNATTDNATTDDAMDTVEADVHAQLRATFTRARQSVRIDDDVAALVETARQRRSNRHVRDAGTSATSHTDVPGVTPKARAHPASHRRSRWVTIGVPAAAAVILIAVIGAILAVHQQRSQRLVSTSSASCAMVITYQGTSFRPVIRSAPTFTVAERLGTGEIPPCNDTGRAESTEPGEAVTVYRVEGLNPRDGIAYGWPGNPSQVKLLAGALDRDKGFGTLTAGFQAFATAHGAAVSTTPPASSLPPPRTSISEPEWGTGDVPTTMAGGVPGYPPSSGSGTQMSFDARCPADGTHTTPDAPAPSRPLLPSDPEAVVACIYPVSFVGEDARRSSVVTDQATLARLTTDIDALQPPGTMPCTLEKGTDLAIVVFEGSKQRTIWVELYGCGTVTDGINLFIGGRSLAWLTRL